MKGSRILAENLFRKSVDSLDSIENQRTHLQRTIKDTIKHFHDDLIEIPQNLGPLVEIGAERAHRSMALQNYFGICSHAVDISFPSLKSATRWAKELGFSLDSLPTRIVANIMNLPYRSNSVPLIYCFQTHHHLDDLNKSFEEIYRVLIPGGTFYYQNFESSLIFLLKSFGKLEIESQKESVGIRNSC